LYEEQIAEAINYYEKHKKMNKFLQTTLLAVAILMASVFSVLAKKNSHKKFIIKQECI
jgi:hypothetical protein